MNPFHAHTLADLRQLYRGAAFTELNRSYRSTYEIMTFAKRIQKTAPAIPMERHGDEPALVVCESGGEEIRRVREAVRAFQAGTSASLGIILKTNTAARALYELLSEEFQVSLIAPDSTRFAGGISVASIQTAKGLEFDEVLLPQADSRTYASEYDRSLLYIACTRALHRLTLLCTGTPSRLIPRRETPPCRPPNPEIQSGSAL